MQCIRFWLLIWYELQNTLTHQLEKFNNNRDPKTYMCLYKLKKPLMIKIFKVIKETIAAAIIK